MKILIICKEQFGYHVDTFKYCEYLKDKLQITYLCRDNGYEKVNVPKIKIVYIKKSKNKALTRIKFILKSILFLTINKFDKIFIVYFLGASILRLSLNSKNTFLDIRTGDVSYKKIRRDIFDLLLKIESFFFNNITIISHGLANKLRISNYYYLPLGGSKFSEPKQVEDSIRLLYVGTFHNRNLLDCVIGFHNFLMQRNYPSNYHFTLIGDGYNGERENLLFYIKSNKLCQYFSLPGRVSQQNLYPYFSESHVGISYIPICDYYNFQPPTKTFEYLLSGLFVIATSTEANRQIINEDNGILINDNIQNFTLALSSLPHFNSSNIAMLSKKYEWSYIIENYFLKIILS